MQIPNDLLQEILNLLEDIADICEVDEYGKHFSTCQACIAKDLLNKLLRLNIVDNNKKDGIFK